MDNDEFLLIYYNSYADWAQLDHFRRQQVAIFGNIPILDDQLFETNKEQLYNLLAWEKSPELALSGCELEIAAFKRMVYMINSSSNYN